MEILACAACACLTFAACGGSQTEPTTGGGLTEGTPPPRPSGPVSATGSSEARAIVGSAGGTLSLENGARVMIPAGALSEPVEVTLSHGAEGQAFGDRESMRALGPMFEIAPALRSEGPSFVVSIPEQPIPAGWAPDDLALAMEEIGPQRPNDTLSTNTRWVMYPIRVTNGRLECHTDGLQGHRVQFGVSR